MQIFSTVSYAPPEDEVLGGTGRYTNLMRSVAEKQLAKEMNVQSSFKYMLPLCNNSVLPIDQAISNIFTFMLDKTDFDAILTVFGDFEALPGLRFR